jgi:protease I
MSKINLAKKKIIIIIAPENFQDEEFFEPKQVFEKYRAKPIIATKIVKVARGQYGSTARIDIDYSFINAQDFDAIILIGGGGASIFFNDPIIIKLLKDANKRRLIIGAICLAPQILAQAGLLIGKKYTSTESTQKEINKAGGIFEKRKPVVVSGNIVTARGPKAARLFGEMVAKLLVKKVEV